MSREACARDAGPAGPSAPAGLASTDPSAPAEASWDNIHQVFVQRASAYKLAQVWWDLKEEFKELGGLEEGLTGAIVRILDKQAERHTLVQVVRMLKAPGDDDASAQTPGHPSRKRLSLQLRGGVTAEICNLSSSWPEPEELQACKQGNATIEMSEKDLRQACARLATLEHLRTCYAVPENSSARLRFPSLAGKSRHLQGIHKKVYQLVVDERKRLLAISKATGSVPEDPPREEAAPEDRAEESQKRQRVELSRPDPGLGRP